MNDDLNFILIMREYAKSQSGVLLSDEFLGKSHPYKWACYNGHIFVKTYWELKDHNKFCKLCLEKEKNSNNY